MAVLRTHDLMCRPNAQAPTAMLVHQRMLSYAAAHSEAAHMRQAFDSQAAFLQIISGPLLASSFPSILCCSVAHVTKLCFSMLGSIGVTQAQLPSAALQSAVHDSS